MLILSQPSPAFDSTMHRLLHDYGYVAVAAFTAAEGLGIPVPGETALIAAAAAAARGHLYLPWVIVASSVGVALGGCGGYWIGRTGGHALVVRYGKWIGIREQELDQAKRFFERRGTAAVALGRFLPVIRILTGIVAGITKMPFWRFATVNALAGVVWSTLFGVLGYEFGHNLARLQHQYGTTVVIVLAALVVVGFLVFKWHERRLKQAPASSS